LRYVLECSTSRRIFFGDSEILRPETTRSSYPVIRETIRITEVVMELLSLFLLWLEVIDITEHKSYLDVIIAVEP